MNRIIRKRIPSKKSRSKTLSLWLQSLSRKRIEMEESYRKRKITQRKYLKETAKLNKQVLDLLEDRKKWKA